MKSKLKNKLNIILLVFVTIIVLYVSLKDNFFDVIEGFKKLNFFWVVISVILTVGYYYFRSLSLYTFAKKFKKIEFKSIFKISFITQFFDGITPSSSGGQPYQIYALNKKGITLVDSTNIAIQNFIVYQIALVLLGLIAVLSNNYLNLFYNVGKIKNLIFLGFVINVIVIIGLFSVAFMRKLNKTVLRLVIKLFGKFISDKDSLIENSNMYIDKFHDGAVILLKNKKDLIKTIMYNFFALSLMYVIPLVILYGLGDYYSLNIYKTIVASAHVMLIGSFIPIPGASGGIEYAFNKFFGVFISDSSLTLVMLLWRFITYYLGVIVGAILLNIRKKR